MPNKDEQEKEQVVTQATPKLVSYGELQAKIKEGLQNGTIEKPTGGSAESNKRYEESAKYVAENTVPKNEEEARALRSVREFLPENNKPASTTTQVTTPEGSFEGSHLSEDYTTKDSEEPTEIKRQNKTFERNKSAWANTEGTTGSKRNELNEDGSYHWEGHTDDDGNWVSGLAEWTQDNETRLQAATDFALDGNWHSEEEMQVYQQEAANLYYDNQELESYVQKQVDEFKAQYDQSYASASEEDKKNLDAALKNNEEYLAYIKGMKEQSKSVYDTLTSNNDYFGQWDKKQDVEAEVNNSANYSGGYTVAELEEKANYYRQEIARLTEKQKHDYTKEEYGSYRDAQKAAVEDWNKLDHYQHELQKIVSEDKKQPGLLQIAREEEKQIRDSVEKTNRYIDYGREYALKKTADGGVRSYNADDWKEIQASLLQQRGALDKNSANYFAEKKAIDDKLDYIVAVTGEDVQKEILNKWSNASAEELAAHINELEYGTKTPTVSTSSTPGKDSNIQTQINSLLREMDGLDISVDSDYKKYKELDAQVKELQLSSAQDTETGAVQQESTQEIDRTPMEEYELGILKRLQQEKQNKELDAAYEKKYGGMSAVDAYNDALDEVNKNYTELVTTNSFSSLLNEAFLRQGMGVANGMGYAESYVEQTKEGFKTEHAEALEKAAPSQYFLLKATKAMESALKDNKDYSASVQKGKANAPDISSLRSTFEQVQNYMSNSHGLSGRAQAQKALAGLGMSKSEAEEMMTLLSAGGIDARYFTPTSFELDEKNDPGKHLAYGEKLGFFNEDETNNFYYLWEKEGAASAMRYALGVNNILNSEYKSMLQENKAYNVAYQAENNPFSFAAFAAGSPVVSALTGMTALPDYLKTVSQIGATGMSFTAPTMSVSEYGEMLNEVYTNQVGTSVEEATGGVIPESWARFGYGVYGSIIQSQMTQWMGSGLASALGLSAKGAVAFGKSAHQLAAGAFSDVTFFSSAAMSTYRDFTQNRGVEPGTALLASTFAGIAEAAFEHFSFDKLYHAKDTKDWTKPVVEWLWNTVVSSGIEGSEEGFTSMANYITEGIILGKDSSFRRSVNEYQLRGYDFDTAYRLAFDESVKSLALDIAAGAVSGGISSGATSVISYKTDQSKIKSQAKIFGERMTKAKTKDGTTLAQKLGEYIVNYDFTKATDAVPLTSTQQKELDTLKTLAQKASEGKATDKEVAQIKYLADRFNKQLYLDFAAANLDTYMEVSLGGAKQASESLLVAVLGEEEAEAFLKAYNENPEAYIEDSFKQGLREALGESYTTEYAEKVEGLMGYILSGNATYDEETMRKQIQEVISDDATRNFIVDYFKDRLDQYNQSKNRQFTLFAKNADPTTQPWFVHTTSREALVGNFEDSLINVWSGVKEAVRYAGIRKQAMDGIKTAVNAFNDAVNKSSVTAISQYRDNRDFFITKDKSGKDIMIFREVFIDSHKNGIDPITGEKSSFTDLMDDDRLNAEFDGLLQAAYLKGDGAEMVRYNLTTGKERTRGSSGAYTDFNIEDLRSQINEIDKQLEDLYSKSEEYKAQGGETYQQHLDAIKTLEARKTQAQADLKILEAREKVRQNGRTQSRNSGTSGRNANANGQRNAGGIPYRQVGSDGQNSGGPAGVSTASPSTGGSSGRTVQQVILQDGDTTIASMENGSVVYDSSDPKADKTKLTKDEQDVLQLAEDVGVDRLIFVDADQLYAKGSRAAGYFTTIDGEKTIFLNLNRGVVNGYHEAMHYMLSSYTIEEKRAILGKFISTIFNNKEEANAFLDRYDTLAHQQAYSKTYDPNQPGGGRAYQYVLFEEMLCDLWKGLNRYNIGSEQFTALQQKAYAFVIENQIMEHAKASVQNRNTEQQTEVQSEETTETPAEATSEAAEQPTTTKQNDSDISDNPAEDLPAPKKKSRGKKNQTNPDQMIMEEFQDGTVTAEDAVTEITNTVVGLTREELAQRVEDFKNTLHSMSNQELTQLIEDLDRLIREINMEQGSLTQQFFTAVAEEVAGEFNTRYAAAQARREQQSVASEQDTAQELEEDYWEQIITSPDNGDTVSRREFVGRVTSGVDGFDGIGRVPVMTEVEANAEFDTWLDEQYEAEQQGLYSLEAGKTPQPKIFNETADPSLEGKFSIETDVAQLPKQDITISGSGSVSKSTATTDNGELYLASVRELRNEAFRNNKELIAKYGEDGVEDRIKLFNTFLDQVGDYLKEAGETFHYLDLADINNATLTLNPMTNELTLTSMVTNGEYEVNFDFGTICERRQALQTIVDNLLKNATYDKNGHASVNLNAKTLHQINEILSSQGINTACLICFVETKRYGQQKQFGEFTSMWNKAVRKELQRLGMEEEFFDFKNGVSEMSEEHIQNRMRAVEVKNEATREANRIKAEQGKKAGETTAQAVNRMVKALAENSPEDLRLLDTGDIQSMAGRTNLAEYFPELDALIKKKGGTAAPKPVYGFSPYNGELEALQYTGKEGTLQDHIKKIGGVRSQSFSDFIVTHVYDHLQKTGAMAARGLAAHTYTKVLARAYLFGLTGEKINMSVLFDIDPEVNSWYAGLDEETQDIFFTNDTRDRPYNFSDYRAKKEGETNWVQSFPWDDAVRLQNTTGYSQNVGTIGVALSYWHYKWMLADPEIRMIIGYHSSSYPADIKNATRLGRATDYTGVQNVLQFVGFARPNYNIPEGTPSYATPPASVKPKKGMPKVSTVSTNPYSNLSAVFQQRLSENPGVSKGDVAKALMQEILDYADQNGLVLVTKKAEGGHGSFDLYGRNGGLEETNDPRATANNFIAYSFEKGYLPSFYEFSTDPNYYKQVFDFNVIDKVTGQYAPQKPVQVFNDKGGLNFPKDFMPKLKDYMKEYDRQQGMTQEFINDDQVMEQIREITEGSFSLDSEQLDEYRPQYIEAIQQMRDRTEAEEFLDNDTWHQSHQALAELFRQVPDLDYLSRLANATTAKEKKQIRAEFEQLLSGINDRDALWQLGAYSVYASYGVWNGLPANGYFKKLKSAKRLFSNIVEARRDQILVEAGESTNIRLQDREYTLAEVRNMFDQLNKDQAIADLANKVFPAAETLGLTIRGRNGKRFKKSTVYGHAYGSVVEYNINRFNDLGVTDQQKASVLLHELIHSCTSYALTAYERPALRIQLSPDMMEAAGTIHDIWSQIAGDPAFRNMYGTTNSHEMLAELSEPKFREAMEHKSLWDKLVDAIKRFFGIGTNNALDSASVALDYLLDNVDYEAYLKYAETYNRSLDTDPLSSITRAADAVNAKIHPGEVQLWNGRWVAEEYATNENGYWDLRDGYTFDPVSGHLTHYIESEDGWVDMETGELFYADNVSIYNKKISDTVTDSNGNTITEGSFSLDRDGIASVTYFAGSGTLDYALRDRLMPLLAVEYDPEIRDMFVKNNGNAIMVTDADVNDVNPGAVIAGHVDYFHASPVCKNFSRANNKSGETEMDRSFARSIAKALQAWQPKVFTLENVRGYQGSESLKMVTDTLDELGYNWDVDVYRASDYGAATIRDRLFVRAVKEGELPPKPVKTQSTSWWSAVSDIVDELPTMDDSGLTAARRARLDKMGIDINNLEQPILLLSGTKGGEIMYAYADQPSPTLMTDGSEARIVLTDGTIKKVTPRVYARIQGLDDQFMLPTKRNGETHQTDAFKIVGNGVPTQLTRAIVSPLLDTIERPEGSFSLDSDADMIISTSHKYEDLIDLSEWHPSEHQNMHEDLQERMSNAIALWDRVVDYFDHIDENDPNWLSYEEIVQAMQFDLYNGNYDGEDMPFANEIMISLNGLSKEQDGREKDRTYHLMESLVNHLVVGEADKWTRPNAGRFAPIDAEFSDWYNKQHPNRDPGYASSKPITSEPTGPSIEELERAVRTATDDLASAYRAFSAGLLTSEDVDKVFKRLADVQRALQEEKRRESGSFSLDIDPTSTYDAFGDEVEISNINPTGLTQSELSPDLYYSGDTAYYQLDDGTTIVLNNIGQDSPEAQYINYLEAIQNANSSNTTAAQPYTIPPAARYESNGYNIGESNDGLRRGAEEVPSANQERTLRPAGSNGERYEQSQSQSAETEGVGRYSVEEDPAGRYATLYDPDTDTFVNEDGDVVATDDMYPIGSFTREIFKAMKSGDMALKNVEDIINSLMNRQYNLYEEDINTVRNMIQINDALTPQQKEALYKAMDELVKRYGGMRTANEDKNQDVQFAKKTSEGKTIMKFTQTVARNADQEWLTDEAVRMALTDEAMSYTPMSNDEAIRRAQQRFDRAGSYEKALSDWDGFVRSGDEPKQVDIAFGELLLKTAAEQGRINDAVKLTSDLTILAHYTGQTLQAFRILKKMTPRGQLYYLQSVVNDLNKKYDSRIRSGKMGTLTLNQALVAQLLSSSTREELDNAVEAIKKDLAKQIPATWMDQWNAWRYLAMLGNPRTHIRNILGNAAFMPAVFMKDMLARQLENKFVDPALRMRKAGADLSKDSAYMKRAEQDFEVMAKIIAGEAGGNKFSDIQDILGQRQIFKWGLLDKLEKLNGKALSAEDMGFMHTYYTRAFAEALQARGIKEADVQSFDTTREGRKTLNEIRNWAMIEAQRNTYHDANVLASTLNQLKAKNPVAYVILEGLVPFTKTPANILKRGIEYSPIGLISSSIKLAQDLRSGEYTTSQCIDRFAAGWTGTAFLALGYLLAKGFLGLKLRGEGPDDDKEADFETLQGHQPWSLEVFGKYSFTIDWMAPIALPLFCGQVLYSTLHGDHPDLTDTDNWMFLLKLADPMLSLSMLDGIENTLSSVASAKDTSRLGVLGVSMFGSYIAQGMPTFLGQIARATDKDRRSTFVPEDAKNSALNRFVQKSILSKLPDVGRLFGQDWYPSEENKMAFVDAWGRTDSSNTVLSTIWKIVENFVSPGYGNIINQTPVDAELQRLYESTGENSVFPNTGAKYWNYGEGDEKVQKNLTKEEYEDFAKTRGQTAHEMLAQMFNSEMYQDATDLEKIKMIDNVYSYADKYAKSTITPEYELDKWMDVAQKIGPVDYILIKTEYEDNKSNEKIFAWLASNPNLSEDQVATLIADKYNMPDNIDAFEMPGYLYELNGNDEDSIKAINESVVAQRLKELKQSDAWKNAEGDTITQGRLLREMYENAKTETALVYSEALSHTDRVQLVGKASSLGSEAFSKVLELSKDEQIGFLSEKYRADATLHNPLHEGYDVTLSYSQRQELQDRFKAAWGDDYDALINSEEFKNASNRQYQENMIAEAFNKTSAAVEKAYVSELYQNGLVTEKIGTPNRYTDAESYRIATELFDNPTDQATWLAQRISSGSAIDDPDRPGYQYRLTTAQSGQIEEEIRNAFIPRYEQLVNDPDFNTATSKQQAKRVKELMTDVSDEIMNAYARQMDKNGYGILEYDKNVSRAEFYEYIANESGTSAEKKQIFLSKYSYTSIADPKATEYHDNVYFDYIDANWEKYYADDTAAGYEKLHKAALDQAAKATKAKYGTTVGKIPDPDYSVDYYADSIASDLEPAVDINAGTAHSITTVGNTGYVIPPAEVTRSKSDGAPSWEELLELNENPDRYNVGDQTTSITDNYNPNGPVYHFEDYIPAMTEEEAREEANWQTANQNVQIFPNAVDENSIAHEIATEYYFAYLNHPDYAGQTYEDWLNNHRDFTMTPAGRRTYSGTGQKAERRGTGLTDGSSANSVGGASQNFWNRLIRR